jgi:hypothetical protein
MASAWPLKSDQSPGLAPISARASGGGESDFTRRRIGLVVADDLDRALRCVKTEGDAAAEGGFVRGRRRCQLGGGEAGAPVAQGPLRVG